MLLATSRLVLSSANSLTEPSGRRTEIMCQKSSKVRNPFPPQRMAARGLGTGLLVYSPAAERASMTAESRQTMATVESLIDDTRNAPRFSSRARSIQGVIGDIDGGIERSASFRSARFIDERSVGDCDADSSGRCHHALEQRRRESTGHARCAVPQ